MKQNVGLTDRIIRVMIAIILGSVFYMDFVSGTAAIIVVVLAVINLVTGIIGWCAIYAALGISTAAEDENDKG